jgi:hypothetical protein
MGIIAVLFAEHVLFNQLGVEIVGAFAGTPTRVPSSVPQSASPTHKQADFEHPS